MAIIRKLAALGALLAAAVLLFVVVCPITPTPTAVITARNSAPVNSIAVGLAFILPALFMLYFGVLRLRYTDIGGEVAPPLSVRMRTCIQLC